MDRGRAEEQILCLRTPPGRLIFFKMRLCRMNAGSGQMVNVYFQSPCWMSLANSVLQLLIIVLFELIWQYGFNHCLTYLKINNISIQDKNTPTKFPVNEIEQWQPTPHQLPIFVKSGNIWPFSEIKKKNINLPIQSMYTPAKFHVHHTKTKEVLSIIQNSRNRSLGSLQDR